MCSIGDAVSGLERCGASFTVESLAKELRQEWVEEALREDDALAQGLNVMGGEIRFPGVNAAFPHLAG